MRLEAKMTASAKGLGWSDTHCRDQRMTSDPGGRGPTLQALGLAAVWWACLATPGSVWAEICPRATIIGSSPELVAEVRRLSKLSPMSTSTPTTSSACTPSVVQVEPAPGGGVRLVMTAGEQQSERVVGSAATAASLIAAWTAPALTDLSWLGGAPAPADALVRPPVAGPGEVSGSTLTSARDSLAAPPPPAAPPAPPVEDHAAPASAPPTSLPAPPVPVLEGRAPTWWVGASGVVAQAATRGLELEVARSARLYAMMLSSSLRVSYEVQPNGDDASGSKSISVGLGAHLGRRLEFGRWAVVPGVAVLARWRHVVPSQWVGIIPCGPFEPCSVETPVPGPSPAYEAFTAWGEGSLAVEAPLPRGLGLRALLAFGGTPGYGRLGAPPVEASGPTVRVRQAPILPRWGARAQVAFTWEGP